VGITRLHLEEDAAKNVHVGTSGRMHGSVGSLVDFNRGGTPLMEIVTEPDIPSPEAARATANHLKEILRAVGVSEADMEKGQLRCDANVSIRNPDDSFGTKTELKNMNSFRFVERGLVRELERQREILENGGRVEQTTLHYDLETDEVHELRSKEYAHDYRYFPEPDLLPLVLSEAHVREIGERLPELPDRMLARFVEQFGLSEYDAGVLTADRDLAVFYEKVATGEGVDPKQAANWISGDLRALLNESGTDISHSQVTPEHVVELIELVSGGEVSRSAARDVLATVFETGDRPADVVEREGLGSVDVDELSGVVDGVISSNPDEVERVRGGDERVVGFLVGQVMKATRGNADGGRVRELLMSKLGS
jgi:aspartyl-tRNA(Asn)/glutamyl-tRNA(Gln) amidotransferase subunit B